MKKTVIKWLVEQVNTDCLNSTFIRKELIEKVLAMEKEQIVDAWSAGKKNPFIVQHSECCENNGKQYYNETYGG